MDWKKRIKSFDERRDLIIPGNKEETIQFCVDQFIQIGQQAIAKQGYFAVALSGGSTPHAIFAALSQEPYRSSLDWSKVLCFWSDERSVAPNHPDNNYYTAMQAGLSTLPIPSSQVFRMQAEKEIEEAALEYEELIQKHVPGNQFDLMMLGMGEDGHTASLFPLTHGLNSEGRIAIGNYVPQKSTWRMSLTFTCINRSKVICIYVLGKSKAEMVARALLSPYDPEHLPVQKVGTTTHKALWILDQEAAEILLRSFPFSSFHPV